MGAALYMAPYTCARVAAIALEEVGIEFETRLIRFTKGEHKSAEFKRLNPTGKVPALAINGEVLTENVAILWYLHETSPDANLLPQARTRAERAHHLADLCFCSSTLHPLVTRIRMPHFFAGSDHAAGVKRIAEAAMDEHFERIEQRLADRPWWYGDRWSVMDGYLFWVFWRVERADYDTSRYPRYTAHARAMEQRPAVRRALAREDLAQAQLVAEGAAFIPPRIG